MGLSPAAGRKGRLRLFRSSRCCPRPSSRTAGESVGSQALVQLSPKQPKQGPLEQGRGVQQGEKPVVNLETTPNQKRAESDSTVVTSWSADRFTKQEAEVAQGLLENLAVTITAGVTVTLHFTHFSEDKPGPRPGDLIEIFRAGYEHWALYVGDDRVVHLAPPSEDFEAGSVTSIFSNWAVVRCSRLEDVLHGCPWKINNKLDGTYLPRPVDKIIQRTEQMVNTVVQYSLMDGNCEHFVNNLRYGVARSQQVEHALMRGAKVAGALISAVVDSMRPKPATA